MSPDPLWLVLTGPLALMLPGLVPGPLADRRPGRLADAARIAVLFTLAVAVATLTAVVLRGPLRTEPLAWSGIGFGLYLDALSATMFVLVAFVGVVVVVYSRNYMDGDPQRGRFFGGLCLTLAAVLTVIVSGNLLQFALAWVATSVCLNRLLLFYRERPAAVLAARKKFIASRLGDACLAGALVIAWRTFGSLDYKVIFSAAHALSGPAPTALSVMAVLIVLTGLLKSAQFPLHGWILEVMETPTPVSALLHAGIVNAGGFLVIRMSEVISHAPAALDLLAIVGGFTALFGSVVMLTQTSIKVSLAYSTIAQMGFMMLECGLGAFSAALLHILAHSVYKAHAFLSSGSVIDIARASWTPSPGGQPHAARLAIAIVLVLGVAVVVGVAFGVTPMARPGLFVLVAVVMLGLTHLIANGIDERPDAYVVGRILAQAAIVAAAYFALQWATERALGASVPSGADAAFSGEHRPLDLTIMVLVIGALASLTVFQSRLARKSASPRWPGLYAHVANGLYVNTLANRAVVKFWASPPPRATAPSWSASLDGA